MSQATNELIKKIQQKPKKTKPTNTLQSPKIVRADLYHSESKCVLCGKSFEGFGNNAEPLRKGKCCDACNKKVIAVRFIGSQK